MGEERRCDWCAADRLYVRYHDFEWGVPLHDDRKLFEFLVLEGAQAGLSWITVLRKREAYRRAFDGFDPARVSAYGRERIARLLDDRGIIRNRLKIESAIGNANAFVKVQEEFGSFDSYAWRFVNGRAASRGWRSMEEMPSRSPESDAMSRDLRARGFGFIGSTICYAYMQATGMVNDHLSYCFRYRELGGSG